MKASKSLADPMASKSNAVTSAAGVAYLLWFNYDNTPNITEMSYEKKTAKSYTGCKPVGVIFGRNYYMAGRQSAEMVCATVAEALARAEGICKWQLEASKVRTNDWNSRLGEICKIARALAVPDTSALAKAVKPEATGSSQRP